MRRFTFLASSLLLIALCLSPKTASAQGQPGYNGGGLIANLPTTDGTPATAAVLRTLSRSDLLISRRWLMESAAPAQSVASRPAFKARRAKTQRTLVWVP